MIIERFFFLLLLSISIAAVWGLLRLWRAQRIARLHRERLFGDLAPVGRPAVIAFSTRTCAECRTRQAPALQRLSDQLGAAVTVRSLQAHEHPELVDRLGILTVPATVILDADGIARHTNLGFTDTARLAAQVRSFTPAQQTQQQYLLQ
jgi:hypothetical protein